MGMSFELKQQAYLDAASLKMTSVAQLENLLPRLATISRGSVQTDGKWVTSQANYTYQKLKLYLRQKTELKEWMSIR